MLTMRKYLKETIITFLCLTLLASISYGAERTKSSEWKSFDASTGDTFNFSFGKYIVTIQPGAHLTSPFREDNLTMTIKKNNDTIIRQDFVSSYGRGSVLLKSDYLFMEYGVGRGTGVREEHIKAYTLLAEYEFIKNLIELFDIQKSYMFPDSKPVAYPYKVKYEVRVIEEKKNLRVIFSGAEKGFGIPQRKEIILNKMVNN